ncbi:hypothetical protein QBC45DRAFT_164731 [Copromyces sp. CBS 386.78]|nr:hypothetical protein QBC45DRAFT_164731 [Copromyces sp. CBS 386.78]
MMSSSQPKDKKNNNTNTNTNNRENRKSKSLRLSQKLRGIGKDLRLRVSVDGKRRRESLQEPSPQEDQEYRIIHTPDRPNRFVSPVEAPTEDDCYDAIRTWQRVAERERSGIYRDEYGIGVQQQQRSVGEEPTDTGERRRGTDDGNDGSSGPFVPDPNDDLKTPKDGTKWWELQDMGTGEYTEMGAQGVGGMNPFREWERHGGSTTSGSSLQLKPPTAAPELTLLTQEKRIQEHSSSTIDGDNNLKSPLLLPSPGPGGRYFDVDEEYTPSSASASGEKLLMGNTGGSERSFLIPSSRNLFVSSQTQTQTQTHTLHSELLKLAHRQRQEQERNGSGQSGERGNSAFYSAFTSSRAETPDVRPPSRRGEGQQQEQEQEQRQQQQQQRAGPSLGTHRTLGTGTETSTPETPCPNSKQKPKQTQQQKRPRPPVTPPKGFLKDRRPYIPPLGTFSPKPPLPPPTTPEKQPLFLLNGLDFVPSRPVPPIPTQTPIKPGTKMATGTGTLGGNYNLSSPRPVPTPTPTTKPKNIGSTGMGGTSGHMGGHIAGAMSISSLSSLTSLTGSGGSVTPARVSPPKPKVLPPPPRLHPPPSLPPGEGDGDGLFTLPATVYSGNSKFKTPVAVSVPVPSPLSKFNTTHPSSSGAKDHSTSNRLPQSQSQSESQSQSQKQERTEQSSSDFSEYLLHPRISDPFVDSPTSDMDSMIDDRFSVAIVNGVYNQGQAHAWKETMAMMGQKHGGQRQEMQMQMQMQMQKPKLIRVPSQKQRQQAKERVREGQGMIQTQMKGEMQSESLGKKPLQTMMTQRRPEGRERINSASKTLPRTPPPQGRTRTSTHPRQHRPSSPTSFRKQSPQRLTGNIGFAEKQKEKQKQQNAPVVGQQRPISVSSVSSDSSYESLQFWKTRAAENVPLHTGVEGDGSGQRGRFALSDCEDGRQEKVGMEMKRVESGGGDELETESESGKGAVVSVDDYEHIIDQYAGGWRETLFFAKGAGGV